jgi:hypothetical protein
VVCRAKSVFADQNTGEVFRTTVVLVFSRRMLIPLRDIGLIARAKSHALLEGLAVVRGILGGFLNVDTCNADIVSVAVRLTGSEVDATTVGFSTATKYVLAFAAIEVHLRVEPDGRGDPGRTICTGRRAQGNHDDAETGEYSGDELHRRYRVKRESLGLVLCESSWLDGAGVRQVGEVSW